MSIEIIEIKEFKLIAHLVEEVQNLHANLFPALYKPFEYSGIEKAIAEMLSDKNCRAFAARLQDETIGYLLLLIKEVPESAFHFSFRIMHIDQITVLQKQQQTGVGTLLIEKAEALAKDLDINRIELDHLDTNGVAKSFFQGKGFLPYRNKLLKQIS